MARAKRVPLVVIDEKVLVECDENSRRDGRGDARTGRGKRSRGSKTEPRTYTRDQRNFVFKDMFIIVSFRRFDSTMPRPVREYRLITSVAKMIRAGVQSLNDYAGRRRGEASQLDLTREKTARRLVRLRRP